MPRLYTTLRERYYVRGQLQKDTAFALKDLATRSDLVLRRVEWQPAEALSFEQAVGRLLVARHPSLPVVRDAFGEAESAWLVTEPEIGAALEQGPYDPDELRRWAEQLLDALDYLHTFEPPVAHGAVNPANLVLRPGGTIALRDYGQNVLVDSDVRADLHALAATLHQLATGHPVPPDGEREEALAQGTPDPVSLAEPFGGLLAAALALDPAQRPASARELLALLEQPAEPARVAPLPGVPQRASPPAGAPELDVAQLPAAPAPVAVPIVGGAARRGTSSRVALVAVIAGLFALALAVFWPGTLPGRPGVAPAPTAAPAQPSPAQPSSAQPSPVATAVPAPTAAATSTAQPTASPAPPTATTPSVQPSPAAAIAGIAPQSVYAGRPFTITVTGANLGAVQAARLLAAEQDPVDLTVLAASDGDLTLGGEALATLPVGDTLYRVELDGVLLDGPTVVLRDYIAQTEAKGILAEYIRTGSVRDVAGRLYTLLLAEAKPDSAEAGVLQQGDSVALLDDQQPDWYRVRIVASVDSGQIGKSGWVPRWLIDGGPPPVDAPPQASSAAFVFRGRIVNTATDSAAQCGADFKSTIYGKVINDVGRPISGALVRVTSADGQNRYQATTNSEGGFSISGLGCTRWIVRLVSIPDPRPVQADPVTVRNLNGGALTAAEIWFQLQP
jgi:hypothetical protein